VVMADIKLARILPVAAPGRGPISALAWSPDGTHLAFGTETGFAAVVDFSMVVAEGAGRAGCAPGARPGPCWPPWPAWRRRGGPGHRHAAPPAPGAGAALWTFWPCAARHPSRLPTSRC
jgi:hypothetical protein